MSHDEDFKKPSLDELSGRYDISLPDVKSVDFRKLYAYENAVDFETMEEVNRAIGEAKIALFEANNKLSRYEAKLAVAETGYKRAWRREYLSSGQKTDAARKTEADVNCEELEDEVIVHKQVREDLKRLAYALRIEMQSLQTVASNIRQQLNL